MTIYEVVAKIRNYAADEEKRMYSDYQVAEALKDSFRLLFTTLAEVRSTIPRKEAIIKLNKVWDVAPLPEDFYTLAKPLRGARIINDRIEAIPDHIWRGWPMEVNGMRGGWHDRDNSYHNRKDNPVPPRARKWEFMNPRKHPLEIQLVYNCLPVFANTIIEDVETQGQYKLHDIILNINPTILEAVMVDVVNIASKTLSRNEQGISQALSMAASRFGEKREYASVPDRDPFP